MQTEKPLLSPLRTWTASAQPSVTTSEDYFKEAGIAWTGNNFKAQFIGLEVSQAEARELSVDRLEETSLDAPILAQLGSRAEIAVSQLRDFLSKHRESKEWFVSYLRGKDGNLWAVHAFWDVDYRGWDVGAGSIEARDPWDAGNQIVSCK